MAKKSRVSQPKPIHNNVHEMFEFGSNSVKYGHKSEKELSHVSAKSAVSIG